MVLYRIAMRTARPLKTWWAMRFSSSSAMSEAISTPRLLGPGQRVLHPGLINRGVESAADIADDDENLIAHQVFSGLAVRMAILYRTIVGYSDGAAGGEVPS